MLIHDQIEMPVPAARYDMLASAWHSSLSAALGFEPAEFRAVTGALGRGTFTPAGLTLLADTVPRGGCAMPMPRLGKPSRAAAYARLLNALAPEVDTGIRGRLGIAYGDWIRYRNAARPGRAQADLFARWSARLPARDRHSVRKLNAAAADPLDILRDAMSDASATQPLLCADGQLWNAPVYDGIDQAAARWVSALKPRQLVFDTLAMCEGTVPRLNPPTGRPVLLPAAGKGDLQARFARARLRITGRIGARAAIPVNPGPWYDSETVERARMAEHDPDIWDGWSTAGRWETFFGARGLLRTHVTHIVMVSDYELELISDGIYDESDMALVKRGLHRGIWPFLASQGAGTHEIEASLTRERHLKVRLRLPAGVAQCWGCLIEHP